MGMKYSNPALTQVHVLGWDKDINTARAISLISIGHNLHSSELDTTNADLTYIRCGNPRKSIEEVKKVEQKISALITPLVSPNWTSNAEKFATIIEECKTFLKLGLKELSDYTSEPRIVFYELSGRTNYVFLEPEIELKDIVYNRI